MATVHPFNESRAAGHTATERANAAWHRFVTSNDTVAFYQSWFSVLCEQLEGVRCGALLLHAHDTDAFAPVAIWPTVTQDLSFLGGVVERALGDAQGTVVEGDATRSGELHVAYPVQDVGTTRAVVALAIENRPQEQIQSLLRAVHWSLGWLQEAFVRSRTSVSEARLREIGALCEIVAGTLREIPLEQTLYEAANHLARHLACSRVAIGLIRGTRVRLAAYSDAAGLEKNTDADALYRAAMEEALDASISVQFCADTQQNTASAHAELAYAFGAKHVITTQLLLGSRAIGALVVERHTNEAFSSAQNEWLDALAPMLAGAIEQKRVAELSYAARIRRDMAAFVGAVVGPRYLAWKFAAIALVAACAALVYVDLDYNVRAKTVIEGQVQRTAAVPFQGFVAASFVRAGDTVRKGQLLCMMDDRELKLEHDKAASEHEQRLRELREAMAEHDLTRIQLVDAQVREAAAQLALLKGQLARARVIAPFDGIVIAGDLSELVGTPVDLGKELFRIAPLHGYRVILQVDESEIRHVHEHQRGWLLVAGIVSDPLPFAVGKVTPISTAKEGANYFRVEATLDQAPANLRPGMEGIGKIEVGERPLWWILGHSFTDWLRLKLWRWLP